MNSNHAAMKLPRGGDRDVHVQQADVRGNGAPKLPQPLTNFLRSSEFFARVAVIYGAYKVTQLRAAALRAGGVDPAPLWHEQHSWAGDAMYDLCVSLRGFYLKAGQFIGARADFIPEQICRRLSLLQDRVPPMPAARARQVLCEEFGVEQLSEVFDWIDLDEPIGSASVSQVHKAQLRRFPPSQLAALSRRLKTNRQDTAATALLVCGGDTTAWGVCNSHGISLSELQAANPRVDLDNLREGQALAVPVAAVDFAGSLADFNSNSSSSSSVPCVGINRRTGVQQVGAAVLTTTTPTATTTAADCSGRLETAGSVSSGSNGWSHPLQNKLPWWPAGGSRSAAAPAAAAAAAVEAAGRETAECSSSGGSSSSSSSDWLEPGASILVAGGESGGEAASPSSKGRTAVDTLLLTLLAARGGGGGRRNAQQRQHHDDHHEHHRRPRQQSDSSDGPRQLPGQFSSAAAAAVARAAAAGTVPDGGLVAVKVQYPGALSTMTLDLVNLRATAAFLQRTELRFDLLSAVQELQRQIHLEFDFMREARVMDTIAGHLSCISSRVVVPRSVPGLVTQRVMVMSFMEGTPLMQLRERVAHLPKWKRDKAARRVLERVSEAYGRMLLLEGLFQADGHPGNILVQQGGRIALLDYGQSKQLGPEEREAFARLILELDGGTERSISEALGRLNVLTSSDDAALRTEMAYGMFDTRGRVDPFDANSPIKRAAIQSFPPDMFFVLRVVQLLRGMANGMGVEDFSTARQWAPLAREALAKASKARRCRRGAINRWRGSHMLRAQPVADLAALASPLRLTA